MPNNNGKFLEKFLSKTKIYIVIIAIILIILCINVKEYTVPSIILFVLVSIYSIWVSDKKRGEFSSYIDELAVNVDNAAKSTVINSPFPLILMKADGEIIWRSKKFNKTFANVGINAYLDEIVKEMKKELNNKEKAEINKEIEIGDKTYKIIGEYSKNSIKDRKKENKSIIILYFIDITEQKEILKEYEESKTCVGIVMIDNYEEIMQRLLPEEKPQVIAAIEKILYKWINKAEGIVIKTERDTFNCIFDKKYLKQMEEEKFNILDEIKEIKMHQKLQLTLSIAISADGNSNYDKYQSASASIDIALGRGGDQAVIKENNKYSFFGGKTQEVEKRTKVKARMFSHALEELILKSSQVVVMGHFNGDIDSIGSSLGLYRLVKTLGKDAFVVNNTHGLALDSFIQTLKADDEYKDIILDKQEAIGKVDENTLLIVVDTHKSSYVEVPEILEKTDKIVIIDHHRRSTDFIENAILTFHEVYASSAAELVTEVIQYSSKSVELKQIEAESLYAGIMMDTKNFTFKTGVRTFEAAAYLRKYGIDIIKVKKWFQSDLESYSVIADIVKNAEIVNETIGISEYPEKDKNANLICAKAADELLTISNITASFVIGNLGDKICISGRSIGDINVQIILEKLRRRRTYHIGRCSNRRNDFRRSKTRANNQNK